VDRLIPVRLEEGCSPLDLYDHFIANWLFY
jgi:hypothetical protein